MIHWVKQVEWVTDSNASWTEEQWRDSLTELLAELEEGLKLLNVMEWMPETNGLIHLLNVKEQQTVERI